MLPALDVIHDEQFEQTSEIKHKINRQTDILTDEINDVISTVTECCESLHDGLCDVAQMLDDITDAVLCTQKLVCKGFKAQADLIEEQTKEIKHKINRQTDILTDEIADVISTVTECCESLHDEIGDMQELICRGFKEFDCILTLQTELLACNVTELDDLKTHSY